MKIQSKLIAVIVLLTSVVLLVTSAFLTKDTRIAPGDQPHLPCPPFCMDQQERAVIADRNQALKDAYLAQFQSEPAHVGGIVE